MHSLLALVASSYLTFYLKLTLAASVRKRFMLILFVHRWQHHHHEDQQPCLQPSKESPVVYLPPCYSPCAVQDGLTPRLHHHFGESNRIGVNAVDSAISVPLGIAKANGLKARLQVRGILSGTEAPVCTRSTCHVLRGTVHTGSSGSTKISPISSPSVFCSGPDSPRLQLCVRDCSVLEGL